MGIGEIGKWKWEMEMENGNGKWKWELENGRIFCENHCEKARESNGGGDDFYSY